MVEMVLAAMGLLGGLVVANLGYLIRQEGRLSRMEGRLNGNWSRLVEHVEKLDKRMDRLRNCPLVKNGEAECETEGGVM